MQADGGWDCHVHVFDAAAPARPGHYRPVHRPLEAIEQTAAAHGIGHLVLVQPSVYGTDNGVLLRALQSGAGRHRGVAVVDPRVDDHTLSGMHDAGVRGVRFNLVSPAGHAGDVAADLLALAPRLHERRWHVQWYVDARDLPLVASLQARTGLGFVLDHLASLGTRVGVDDPAWTAAAALAEAGAWIKLSGWYRLGAVAPYAALQPNLERVAAMFGPRMVWGSDWPHTSFAADPLPPYDSTLQPVRAALGGAPFDALLHQQAQALYL